MKTELLLNEKENFIKNGYCTFSLNSFDLEFTKFLEEYLMCSSDRNLQNIFSQFRYDSQMVETICLNRKGEYHNLEKVKQSLYDVEPDKDLISQIWYFNSNWDAINRRLKTESLEKTIQTGLNKIISYLYNLSDSDKLVHNQLQISYYNKNCRLHPHTDGAYEKIVCSILIYLNKHYKKEDGGLLILNDSLVTPEFGTVVVMDLQNHNVFHGVTEVIDGPGRYAILSFPELEK